MGGETENDRLLDFPVDLYPKSFSLLLFPPPGRIVGIDRGDDLVGLRIQDFHVGGRELTGVFTVKEARTNGPFAKMIAKIGYCFAVAEKGFAAFDGDDIRALLRGKRSDVYNFVGSLSKPEVLTARHLHGLYLRERNGWLTALVHLFASLSEEPSGAIPYEVVVGRMTTVMRA